MPDDEELREVAYTLSSVPPIGSLLGVEPVTLLVGLEDEPDGTLRVYLGARWKGIYMRVITPEAQEDFRRAWGGGLSHVWMWPLPPADALCRDADALAADGTEPHPAHRQMEDATGYADWLERHDSRFRRQDETEAGR